MESINKKQYKALINLERAFAVCKKTSLAFQGMDGDLLAFDGMEYNRLTEKKSLCDQQYIENGNQGIMVNTHDCYKDSGGW